MCGNLMREDGKALQWVRCSLPRAVETADQQRLLLDNESSHALGDRLPAA